jgi:hypothetical protein
MLAKLLGVTAYLVVVALAYYLFILGAQLVKDAYVAGSLFGGGL